MLVTMETKKLGNEGNEGLKGIIRIDVGKCREYLGVGMCGV
jgi:hypothetical protein